MKLIVRAVLTTAAVVAWPSFGDVSRAQTLPATTRAAAELPWGDDFAAGTKEARNSGRGMVVFIGADPCPECRRLRGEMASASVQIKLGAWTRVYVDADRDADVVAQLGATTLPELRLLTSAGVIVAARRGFVAGDDLAKWLDQHAEAARGLVTEEQFLGTDAPSAAQLGKLLDALGGADASRREAAIRRLAPHAQIAAVPVAALFVDGKLAERLGAIELLGQWQAPVSQIDPWKPATITPERLEALRQWAAGVAASTAQAAVPTTQAVAAAESEIDRLIAARTDAEVIAIRERLAGLKMALLPRVYERLKTVTADVPRERLTALRYRLLSTDKLALGWPGGLERLSSTDTPTRHKALDELSQRISPAEAPLLLELFSDPDPFVRESSLRLLQKIGAGGAEGLSRLLKDPEPNVRAAVLKQLTENPDPALVGNVVAFVDAEKDVDLVVHAMRVLRAAKKPVARSALVKALSHESWRVRAEAAEALGEQVGDADPAKQAEIYAALIARLSDEDSFVVGQCVQVLARHSVPEATKAMIDAAERQPQLALEVIKALGSGRSSMPAHAEAFLRRATTRPDAGIRAAAIRVLSSSDGADPADVIAAGIKDADATVRETAATALLAALQKLRPQDGYITKRGFLGLNPRQVAVDMNKWLVDFRAGKDRPAWLGGLADDLLKMLPSPADDRILAAVALVALGRDDDALPVLRNAPTQNPALRSRAALALPWLPPEPRMALYRHLLAIRPAAAANPPTTAQSVDDGDLGEIAEMLAQIPQPEAAEALWELLADPAAGISRVDNLQRPLRQVHMGNNDRYGDDNSESLKKFKLILKEKAARGVGMQRLASLVLLLENNERPAAAELAAAAVQDASASDLLRSASLQVQLAALSRDEAEKVAVQALSSAKPEFLRIALPYLAVGDEAIRMIQGEIYLSTSRFSEPSGKVIPVLPPKGLTIEQVRPLLDHADAPVRNSAAYLAVVLGDKTQLPKVIDAWKAAPDDEALQRAAYRAITAVNDDEQTPVLAEIYKAVRKHGDWRVGPLYWTIRGMQGPKVLALRKQIRAEVGMDRLR